MQVEIVEAILRTLGRPYVLLLVNNGSATENTFDIIGNLRTDTHFRSLNVTPTNPILYERLSVVMSDRPISDDNDTFALLNPFSQSVWLAILLLITVKSVYSAVLARYSDVVDECRSFRPSFSATLLPIAFGVVLLTALYKNNLLASFLLQKPKYLIANLDDLAYLDGGKKIYVSFISTWSNILHQASATQRAALDEKRNVFIPKNYEFQGFILPEIQVIFYVHLCIDNISNHS